MQGQPVPPVKLEINTHTHTSWWQSEYTNSQAQTTQAMVYNVLDSQPGHVSVVQSVCACTKYPSYFLCNFIVYLHNSMYGMLRTLRIWSSGYAYCTNGSNAWNLTLISRSVISDTKGDTTTTTLLATILLQHSKTVMDVRKMPGVLLYPSKLGDISCTHKVCTRSLFCVQSTHLQTARPQWISGIQYLKNHIRSFNHLNIHKVI